MWIYCSQHKSVSLEPYFLFTTMIGAAQSLLSTGSSFPSSTCFHRSSSTFSRSANGSYWSAFAEHWLCPPFDLNFCLNPFQLPKPLLCHFWAFIDTSCSVQSVHSWVFIAMMNQLTGPIRPTYVLLANPTAVCTTNHTQAAAIACQHFPPQQIFHGPFAWHR